MTQGTGNPWRKQILAPTERPEGGDKIAVSQIRGERVAGKNSVAPDGVENSALSLVRLPLPPLGERLVYARRAAYRFRRELEQAVQKANGGTIGHVQAVRIAAAVESLRRYFSVAKALADAPTPGAGIDWPTWLGLHDRCLRFLDNVSRHIEALGLPKRLDPNDVTGWFDQYLASEQAKQRAALPPAKDGAKGQPGGQA
jgi:hypothetical protein